MHGSEHARFARWILGGEPARRLMTRRRFLGAGALGSLGFAIPGFLGHVRAAAPASVRSCIVLYYYGGPSHLDTWDMKPAAPREIRGEFASVATRVPGVRVSEHLPRCAQVMDKLAVIRSMHHRMRNHNSAAVESLCGRTPLNGDLELLADDRNSFPCYGAVLSWVRTARRDVPTHVALPHVMYNVVKLPGQTPGFLGSAFSPFQVTADPNEPGFHVEGLELPADVPSARLGERRTLLPEARAGNTSLSAYQERAFDFLTSATLRRAFDLSRETERARERYGRNKLGQSLLLARRLVEAGVPFINVNDKITNGQTANWDSHENNFGRLKNELLPPADQAFAALVEDLEARGLLASTLVIALAEFGRTPRINGNAGRDHWPDCFSAVLAGGGVRGGTVHGASDRIGAYPDLDPVTPGDLAATIFWRFGLDRAAEMRDLTGRPYRVCEGEPLRRLFG
jgi:hypothetical protein